jgi:hypothetical protein
LDTEKIRPFFSGSSAPMLRREMPTSVRGRAMEVTVFPFSFREALLHHYLLLENEWDLLPNGPDLGLRFATTFLFPKS